MLTEVRIGRGSLRTVFLIVLGISAAIALFIAAPMTQFGPLIFGTQVHFLVGYLASVVVLFILIAPLLLPRATRPLWVDEAGTTLRVGLRRIPASELRRAYRLPDSQFDGRFQLKLGLPGLDALVAISGMPPAELSTPQLDALLRLLENAPIEPDPAVPLRPPLGDELGPRDSAQRFDDSIADQLLPFETMAFAKATLLAEVRRVRQLLEGQGVGGEITTIRDIGLVAPGSTTAPRRQAALAEAEIELPGPKRGFWGTMGAAYRGRRDEVENWLGAQGGTFLPRSHGRLWWLGLALIVFALVAPWASIVTMFGGLFYYILYPLDPIVMMGTTAFLVLAWPFIAWPGFVMMWRARVVRYEEARSAALAAKRRGVAIPKTVSSFFGPDFPEVAYRAGLLWLLIFESIVLLVGGITATAIGFGQVENWDALPLTIALGVVMVLASIPVFAWAVRVIRDGAARRLRDVALWNALASTPPGAPGTLAG